LVLANVSPTLKFHINETPNKTTYIDTPKPWNKTTLYHEYSSTCSFETGNIRFENEDVEYD
jgi:hypothetical protein